MRIVEGFNAYSTKLFKVILVTKYHKTPCLTSHWLVVALHRGAGSCKISHIHVGLLPCIVMQFWFSLGNHIVQISRATSSSCLEDHPVWPLKSFRPLLIFSLSLRRSGYIVDVPTGVRYPIVINSPNFHQLCICVITFLSCKVKSLWVGLKSMNTKSLWGGLKPCLSVSARINI